jgi:hypothetical protein
MPSGGVFCVQIVLPVSGSYASARPTPFEEYITPPTMIGVAR